MIRSSSSDHQKAKQEEKALKGPNSSSSRQWSSAGFRNPRIVRVSRSFGGKDRHSKVCTVRGLRDRRIRLSVPTAVQLYDLQDRLGLSQPSKVIDWLIDATKSDIDKLPPLQFPPGPLLPQNLLNIVPNLLHDDATKTNENEPYKLFGMSSYLNYHHQASQNLSLAQFGFGHSSSSSSSSSQQLLFCAQPNSVLGQYPQFITDHHDQTSASSSSSSSSSSSLSQIMDHNHHNNIQFLTSGGNNNLLMSTSSSQHNHGLANYSLMSSLHNSRADNSPPNLVKSFPAIFNPRLFSQSSFENRPGKDHG